MKLNIEILERAGGSWRKPPQEEKILRLEPAYRVVIARLIEKKIAGAKLRLGEMSKRRNRLAAGPGVDDLIWGWKDPRTTLTIRLYEPHLQDPHFIASFRDPVKVAESLCARSSRMTIEQGVDLAREYNRRLVTFLQHRGLM
jgi:hypothetical protein